MLASELMRRGLVYVTADADLDYVARALASSPMGVVAVVDDNLTPIGIVTRSNLEKARPPVAAELGPIPEFLLQNRRKPVFRGNGKALVEIMTTPPIFVPCEARLAEAEKVMAEHRLKRMPVVEGHKLVGVLLRREVAQALSGGRGDATLASLAREPTLIKVAPPEPDFCEIATAGDFRGLVAAHERQIESERIAHHQAVMALREQRIRDLAALRLTEAAWRDMLARARAAAANGLTESILIRFPAQLCTDGGRAINAPDPHWPDTLRGEPADVFRRWRNELRPRGFKIAAQIIEFPEGLPGDVALFLIWGSGS